MITVSHSYAEKMVISQKWCKIHTWLL